MQIEYSDQALRNLSNCEIRLEEIADVYGGNSAEYYRAANSFVRSWLSIMRWGGRLTAEDERSFVLVSGGFVMGMVCHPVYKKGERDPLLVTWSCHS